MKEYNLNDKLLHKDIKTIFMNSYLYILHIPPLFFSIIYTFSSPLIATRFFFISLYSTPFSHIYIAREKGTSLTKTIKK